MEVGIDTVEISRFTNLLKNDLFLNKYFDKSEQEYIRSKSKPEQTLAGLYAVKEAILKAFGNGIGGGIDLKQIIVNHKENGKPFVVINEPIKKALKNDNLTEIKISITHDNNNAIAICILNWRINKELLNNIKISW